LCRVVDGFFTDSRCLLLTTPSPNAAPLEGRRKRIVEAILCGVGQKSIAIELGLAPSTVALNARLGLESLGVWSKPSRVHPLLMSSAVAACEQISGDVAALSYLGPEHGSLRVLSIRRPDDMLAARLPPAELAVIRGLIEGVSYVQIAKRRGTSTRTIANQITAVFRRLKVSGRSELLLRLFKDGMRGSCASLELHAPLEPNVRNVLVG
jgi:DNA-binding NarL/FixJ family response regulator